MVVRGLGNHRHHTLMGKLRRQRKHQATPNLESLRQEDLKDCIIMWSGAYYVSYGLLITVAFAMFVAPPSPEPARQLDDDLGSLLSYRPNAPTVDSVVLFAYSLLLLLACYDSVWGMLLCAEWSVRAPTVRSRLYDDFLGKLAWKTQRVRSCSLHICETRAWRSSRVLCGLGSLCQVLAVDGTDPFYFIDRTVVSLFLASGCRAYLTQGLASAACCLLLLALLKLRLYRYSGMVKLASKDLPESWDPHMRHRLPCERRNMVVHDAELQKLGKAKQFADLEGAL